MAKNWGYLTLLSNPSRFIANKGVDLLSNEGVTGASWNEMMGRFNQGCRKAGKLSLVTIVSNFPVKKLSPAILICNQFGWRSKHLDIIGDARCLNSGNPHL